LSGAVEKRFGLILALVLLGGLVVRWYWIWKVGGDVFTEGDQAGYAADGIRLTDPALWLSYRQFYTPPLYPFTVAWTQIMAGMLGQADDPVRYTIGLFQSLLSVVSIALWAIVVRRRSSATVGIVVATFLCLWVEAVTGSAMVMAEQLATPLVTLALCAIYWDSAQPSTSRLAAIGGVVGLAVLTKPVLLPLAIVVPIVMAGRSARGWHPRLRTGAVVAAATLVFLVPWWGFTQHATGIPIIPVATGGGLNACLGNNDALTVTYSTAVAEGDCRSSDLSNPHEDARLRAKAIDWMAAHPRAQPGLVKRRWTTIFGSHYGTSAELYFRETWEAWDLPGTAPMWERISNWQWMTMAVLSFSGLAMLFVVRPRMALEMFSLAAAVLLLPLLTVAEPRYRDAIVPLMVLWAAWLAAEGAPLLVCRLRRPGVSPSRPTWLHPGTGDDPLRTP
jgi:hypothetical protein